MTGTARGGRRPRRLRGRRRTRRSPRRPSARDRRRSRRPRPTRPSRRATPRRRRARRLDHRRLAAVGPRPEGPRAAARLDQPDEPVRVLGPGAARRATCASATAASSGERTDEIAERLDRCTRGARRSSSRAGSTTSPRASRREKAAADLDAMVRRARRTASASCSSELLPVEQRLPGRRRADQGPQPPHRGDRPGAARAVLPFYAALEDPRTPGRCAPTRPLDGDHPT